MEISGERVLVTGGAGFIGSHVVDHLVGLGAHVKVIDDLSVGSHDNLAHAAGLGASLVVGDVRDRDFMEQETRGARAVIHMACANLRSSLSEPLRAHEINATGTLVPALAAVAEGVDRFIYVSSSEAYGSAVTTPMDEDHPLLPTTVYGAAKAAGELYSQACMRTYDLPGTVVRPFNSYGPREHASGNSAEVIPKFTMRIMAGLPPVIFGDGSQTRTFTWVEETARGIVAATRADELIGSAVNISSEERVSIAEIAAMLLNILGAGELQAEYDERRPGDVDHHHAGVKRARDVLGFETRVRIREGLERYVDWVRATGASERVADVDIVRNW